MSQKINNNKYNFPFWVFFAGTSYFRAGQHIKGLIFLLAEFLLLLILIFLIFAPQLYMLCNSYCQSFLGEYIKISDPYALQNLILIPIEGRLAWIILFSSIHAHLGYLNIRHYLYNYQKYELDNRPSAFENSFGLSLLGQTSILLAFLFYGIIYLKPIEREMPIEMIFVNNNIEEPMPKEKPQNPVLSQKNAIDKGQKSKDKLVNGKNTKEKLINEQKKQSKANDKVKARPTSPPVPKPSPAKNESKASKPQNQSKAELKKEEKIIEKKDNGDQPQPKEIKKQIVNKTEQNPQPNRPEQKQSKPSPYQKQNTPSPILNNKNSDQGSSNPTTNSNSRKNTNDETTTVGSRAIMVDYASYQRHIENTIHQYWKPINDNQTDLVIVKFKISKEGRLVPNSINILSSNTSEAQRQAIDSILKASLHFRPLPEGATDTVNINFTFRER